MPLMTLDPTHGTMVPYGTGAVSADGTQVAPDPDPAHPGHRYGLLHFDWHGQMPGPPSGFYPGPGGCTCPDCCSRGAVATSMGGPVRLGDPVDVGSGLQTYGSTDLLVQGTRGSISVQRVYRSLSNNDGPFGADSQIQYAWQLSSGFTNTPAAVNLIAPDGNQYLFSIQPDGTLKNASMPFLQGAVLTPSSGGSTALRYANGTVYTFKSFSPTISNLISITDPNGNTTTFQWTQIVQVYRILQITDPVGRSINLTYDDTGHALTATDPIGRTVTYTYNGGNARTLASFTDAAGGVWSYQYDNTRRVLSETDPRGVVMFQNTYDANGRVSRGSR